MILALALVGNGLGLDGFREFSEKISAFAPQAAENKLGLSSFAWRIWFIATGELLSDETGAQFLAQAPGPLAWAAISLLEAVGVAAALFLLARVLPRIKPWEAACLGLAIIPLFSSPANYYCSFFIAAVMLGERSRRMHIILLSCAILWIANGLVLYVEPRQYTFASFVTVLLPLALLLEVHRTRDPVPVDSRLQAVEG